MVTDSGHSKRPMCQSCSKPARFCLCIRLKTPRLQNSVAITILQHSLEKKHPLNSTRIASIGLQNVSVVSVSDVNYEAEFHLHLLGSNLDTGSHDFHEKTTSSCGSLSIKDSNFDCNAAVSFTVEKYGAICSVQYQNLSKYYNHHLLNSNLEVGSQNLDEKISGSCDSNGSNSINIKGSSFVSNAAVTFTMEKSGAICPAKKQDLGKPFDSGPAIHDLQEGFLVKKLQRKPLIGSIEYQESMEFEVAVPPGSVLLFPSETSIGIEDVDFEVKNLIVLDGTWAKAKRMYNENPWLKVLPHMRLDVEKLSLYCEVRHQPKAGYLSTIESIVYALKAVGEKDSEGLDHLLEVFESMVGDQRRCKDERLKRKLSNSDRI